MSYVRIAGMSVVRFEDPIRRVLSGCEVMTEGQFDFSPAAARLHKMPNLPMVAAASQTPFKHLGEIAGILTVVALGPGDHTGIQPPHYARTKSAPGVEVPAGNILWGVIPRPRPNAVAEAYMPIAYQSLEEEPVAKPILRAGKLSVIGSGIHENGEVRTLGFVGQKLSPKGSMEDPKEHPKPAVFLMTANDPRLPDELSGYQPIGTSYALRNFDVAVQVGAILTLTRLSTVAHLQALELLAERAPRA